MNIEICPLEKVVIDGIDVCLGMERAAVEAAIGKGNLVGKRYYYFDDEMAIDYCGKDKVEFIEFTGGIEGVLRPVLRGVSVFEVQADELFALLKEENRGEIRDAEREYSYQFHNIGIGIYREATPEGVMELIREAESFGNPMSEEEKQYSIRQANHWAAIGMGAAEYYRR